jgi:hypothetical protein
LQEFTPVLIALNLAVLIALNLAVLIALNLAPQLTSFTVRDCVREASGISVEYSECNLNGSRSQQ